MTFCIPFVHLTGCMAVVETLPLQAAQDSGLWGS